MNKYKLEVSEKQLLTMREALEFHSRFLSGQVEDVPSVLSWQPSFGVEARSHLKNFKQSGIPRTSPKRKLRSRKRRRRHGQRASNQLRIVSPNLSLFCCRG